ncbi:MAG: epimerase [Desulfobulbaceae bacterium BRH_c16a]|nr:MAG: epimerase [Desulfobulbaceae bacterium BRH_c16a]
MKIFITGGTGFVGRHLSATLLEQGHQVTAVGRSSKPSGLIEHPSFSYLAADTTRPGDWQARIPEHNVVINLAGQSIFTLWTEKTKQQIYDSRILTTRNVTDGLAGAGDTIFFSTSAAGYYGDRGEDVLTEDEPPGTDFLATVGRDWEREALKAQSDRVRVVLTRFGIVLGRGGGAMASMIPAFKLFVGGHLGDGRQWFPWIHLHDLAAAYLFVMNLPEIAGPVNWCAPHPVRNQELTDKLAGKLNRPALFSPPAFVMKRLLGEFGKSMICSQRVQPAVLQKAGFPFAYGDLDSALEEILEEE